MYTHTENPEEPTQKKTIRTNKKIQRSCRIQKSTYKNQLGFYTLSFSF